MPKRPSIVREYVDFIVHNKAYWLIPIAVVLALFAVLLVLGGSGAAPLIYTLF